MENKSEYLTLICDQEQRLDVFLASKLSLSRNLASKIVEEGVFVNVKFFTKQGYKLVINDVIRYKQLILDSKDLKSTNIPLNIIYEDDDILVINKQRNVVVHPSSGHNDDTIVNALLFNNKLTNFKSEDIVDNRPGIVHRIDKDTSGLLLIAKTKKSMEILQQMIKDHKVEREYYCIVYGKCKYKKFTTKLPLCKPSNSEQKAYVDVKKGKESITHFENVHCNENYSLLHCSLETGRTHQIRVSLFYYDMPILNDPIYNTRKNIQNADKRGQVLHAYKLIFNHPITGEKMILHAPFDEYFKQCLNTCFPQEEIQLDF